MQLVGALELNVCCQLESRMTHLVLACTFLRILIAYVGVRVFSEKSF